MVARIERSLRGLFFFLKSKMHPDSYRDAKVKASLRLVRARHRELRSFCLDSIPDPRRTQSAGLPLTESRFAWIYGVRTFRFPKGSDALSPSLRGLRLMSTALSALRVRDALSRYGKSGSLCFTRRGRTVVLNLCVKNAFVLEREFFKNFKTT